MNKKINIAVVGATGAVGEAMLEILSQRRLPLERVFPLASASSVGKVARYRKQELAVQDLAEFDFSQAEYALFSAGASVSREFAPRAVESGCYVIDNTSEFRYRDEIPLVVPEVNGSVLAELNQACIIANPNCSTIQMLVALAPIQRAVGIDRINVATYQSVSGAGRKGMQELARQTVEKLNFKDSEASAFSQPIGFNVLPQIDVLQDNLYSKEEMKMHWETQKIFADPDIGVNATAVRVPVFYGHGSAVHLETRQHLPLEQAEQLLREAPGVRLIDAKAEGDHPTPLTHASGRDDVFVGRLRQDFTHPNGLDMWVVSDNVRKGAALNAVQILEALLLQRD